MTQFLWLIERTLHKFYHVTFIVVFLSLDQTVKTMVKVFYNAEEAKPDLNEFHCLRFLRISVESFETSIQG